MVVAATRSLRSEREFIFSSRLQALAIHGLDQAGSHDNRKRVLLQRHIVLSETEKLGMSSVSMSIKVDSVTTTCRAGFTSFHTTILRPSPSEEVRTQEFITPELSFIRIINIP